MRVFENIENCGVPIDYAETLREVVALANRGMLEVRVAFPDRRTMTVWGALNKFHLWRYVNAEERERSHYAEG
jgi:hypothetical protein